MKHSVVFNGCDNHWDNALPFGNGVFGCMLFYEDNKLYMPMNHYEVYYNISKNVLPEDIFAATGIANDPGSTHKWYRDRADFNRPPEGEPFCLYRTDRICTLDEISSLTGLSVPVCTISLTKMAALGYLRITDVDLFGEKKISYVYQKGKLDELLCRISDDFLSVCYQGLSSEEIQQYQEIQHRILENLKKVTVKKEER